jgi:hypothetical protein
VAGAALRRTWREGLSRRAWNQGSGGAGLCWIPDYLNQPSLPQLIAGRCDPIEESGIMGRKIWLILRWARRRARKAACADCGTTPHAGPCVAIRNFSATAIRPSRETGPAKAKII